MTFNYDYQTMVDKFEEFFKKNFEKEVYDIREKWPEKRSFYFSYKELEKFDPEIADHLINYPDLVIKAAKEALKNLVGETEIEGFDPHIRIEDLPSDLDILIQDIGAEHINKLVVFQGVITQRSEIRPKVKIGFFRCNICNSEYKIPIEKEMITICDSCKRKSLVLDEESSYFINIQRGEIQELLERVKGGTPAAHIELLMEDDLVNKVIPGDTVQVVGILRLKPVKKENVYGRYIDVINIKNIQKEFEEVELTEEDIKKIHEFSRRGDVFEILKESIAPGIYGYDEVKEALVLQLFGGTSKKRVGTEGSRGEIHILLIGDPGVAKTKILQNMAEIAPKSIYVSGKSTSGVGLTASAEKDEFGGWTLKAGALVLASGGLAAIDEFNLIDKEEQAALHEAMESQTISIAKAGIVARFKSKTAILAAANPKFGRFDPNILPAEQFDISPTLLSRFDLIFPIRDVLDEERDRKLAAFILESHKKAALGKEEKTEKQVDIDFLRKYIAYSRKNVKPVLTPEASKVIEDFYADLRRIGESQKSIPITPRQLEGLLRLSEASAKARLSNRVEIEDSERAIRLMKYVLEQMALDRGTGKYDIDLLYVGIPQSKQEKYREVLKIVKDLSANEEKGVQISEVIRVASERKIDEDTTKRIIEEFLRKGELYEPRPGYVKYIQRFD